MTVEKPILFSAPMIMAILGDKKTMTRRVAKLNSAGRGRLRGRNWRYDDPDVTCACPYGRPGYLLWVREAWRTLPIYDARKPTDLATNTAIQYAVDGAVVNGPAPADGWGRLRPGMFMPRWASRINLEITEVRVERLQDISYQDVMAEGISGKDLFRAQVDAPEAFRKLWESINGNKSWAGNPWVWVVEFKRL